MEKSEGRNEQELRQSEVVLRLNPDELVPADREVVHWRQRLAGQPDEQQAYYCLGGLMATIESAAKAIDRGDQRAVTYHLRSGLAATAAYEQLAAERRAAWEQRQG
jgi:hypothetical protein